MAYTQPINGNQTYTTEYETSFVTQRVKADTVVASNLVLGVVANTNLTTQYPNPQLGQFVVINEAGTFKLAVYTGPTTGWQGATLNTTT
jgi:hypothetical protein